MLKLTRRNVKVQILHPASLCRVGGTVDAGEVIRRFLALNSKLYLRNSALTAFAESSITGGHLSGICGSDSRPGLHLRPGSSTAERPALESSGDLNVVGDGKCGFACAGG